MHVSLPTGPTAATIHHPDAPLWHYLRTCQEVTTRKGTHHAPHRRIAVLHGSHDHVCRHGLPGAKRPMSVDQVGKPDAWGYLPLVSADKKVLVQIFIDLDTGLIESTHVSFREETWHSWGPPIKCTKDDC